MTWPVYRQCSTVTYNTIHHVVSTPFIPWPPDIGAHPKVVVVSPRGQTLTTVLVCWLHEMRWYCEYLFSLFRLIANINWFHLINPTAECEFTFHIYQYYVMLFIFIAEFQTRVAVKWDNSASWWPAWHWTRPVILATGTWSYCQALSMCCHQCHVVTCAILVLSCH